MTFAAYILGFLAAVANTAANILQRAANRDEDEGLQFSLAMIGRLLRKPIWLAGIAAITASFFLQAIALGAAALTGQQAAQEQGNRPGDDTAHRSPDYRSSDHPTTYPADGDPESGRTAESRRGADNDRR